MTKEELEKEAKQSYFDNTYEMLWDAEGDFDYTRGYLDSAEPREKQIQIDAEQIRALQKQNGELTDKVKELEEKLEKETAQRVYNFNKSIEWKEKHRELEAQIEKMKNCKNCANYMISGKCPCFFRTGWCKNWELSK